MSGEEEPVSPKDAKRQAKSDAAADKARAKAERPFWKKKRVIIPAALVLLLIIIMAGTAGDDDAPIVADGNGDGDGDPTEDVEEEVDTGEAAEDGDFRFTVNDFECGVESISSDMGDVEPTGQYCILDVNVENIGDSEQTLSASDQYLIDDQEREFSADGDFEVYMALDSPIFEGINPGNAIDARMAFDVPEDASIQFARLHDSAFSGGILVDLR